MLQDCASIANECNAWREVWAAEFAALKSARATADQLRESVHFQVHYVCMTSVVKAYELWVFVAVLLHESSFGNSSLREK